MLKKSLIVLGLLIIIILAFLIVFIPSAILSSTTPKITTVVQEVMKPSYDYLKSTSVYIIGCSGEIDISEKLTYNLDNGGMCWSGTGVIVKMDDNETYVLTNNHVAGKGKDDVILFVENEDRKFRAEVIEYHSKVDIAVIKVDDILTHKAAIKGISSVEIQDSIFIVGNPLGDKMTYTEGVVANFVGINMLIQAPCIYGSSGSGVFNQYGELVGVVYALEIYPGFLNIPEARITHTLVVDSSYVKAFLQELELYNE